MKVVTLAGGVGGAKLVDGLARIIDPSNLTIIVNTGDDFEYYGLSISPDLDAVGYTLAGLSNPVTGWGIKDETWNTLAQLKWMGGPVWFNLGDKDLATHLERTRLLNEGYSLSEVTKMFCDRWDVKHTILPMSNQKVATKIIDKDGTRLDFQEYFVQNRWEPVVQKIEFSGIETSIPAPGILETIENCELVIFCPSNPYVSINPILNVPGIKAAIAKKTVVAVSPIIGGKAVKGPLAKMIKELEGCAPSALHPAKFYYDHSLLSAYIVDSEDEHLIPEIEHWGIICKAVNTMMVSTSDRVRLAEDVLALGRLMLRRKNNP